MKTKIKQSKIIGSIIFLIWGCGSAESGKNELAQEEKSSFKRINIENNVNTDSIRIESIKSKYNANSAWDTLNFTYQLQENLIEKNAAINADVIDIIKVDTSYYVRLINKYLFSHNRISSFNQVSAYLKINKNQLSKLKNVPISWRNKFGRGRSGVFIFKATSIGNSTNKIINSEFNSETGESSTIEENENILLFYGNLVDYYLFKPPY